MPRQKPTIRVGDVDLDKEVVIVNGERFTEADALAVTDELAGHVMNRVADDSAPDRQTSHE